MSSYVTRKTTGDTSWFIHDRFGMFIHFGLYSLPGRHEWIKEYEKLSEEHYQKYFTHFNPDLFDAKILAKHAKAAGMKYAVLTTKHHEGFCLFDSKYTDYKSTNTPCERDLVREYVDAFRSEGLKIGLYYSLLDWHHPDFPIDRIHPRRNDSNAEELNAGRDMKKYAKYMRDQVAELLTSYGKIDILFFDFSYDRDADKILYPESHHWMYNDGLKGAKDWEADKMIELCRKLQPDIIINDRLNVDQDVWTPEQLQNTEWRRDKKTNELLTWEACQTFSGSWGYNRDEQTWKTPKMLIDLLVNSVAYGGNLIMNVGPTGRGNLDKRATSALEVYAEWMKYNQRSIYDCTMAEPHFAAPEGTRLTQSFDGSRLYIHLQTYPFGTYPWALLKFPSLCNKIDYAQFLHDGSEIIYKENEEHDIIFQLPSLCPDIISPVIEVFLK